MNGHPSNWLVPVEFSYFPSSAQGSSKTWLQKNTRRSALALCQTDRILIRQRHSNKPKDDFEPEMHGWEAYSGEIGSSSERSPIIHTGRIAHTTHHPAHQHHHQTRTHIPTPQANISSRNVRAAVAAEKASSAPSSAATRTYRGMAVHKPGEDFKIWEYQAGPLDPNGVEIKVRERTDD